MKSHAEKPNEHQCHATTGIIQQQTNAETEFQFVDNRAQTANLRQLQESADDSPPVRGLAQLRTMLNNSPRVKEQLLQMKQGKNRPNLAAVSSPVIQRIPITRRMYNLVLESSTKVELEYALANTKYSDVLKEELRRRWAIEHPDVGMYSKGTMDEEEDDSDADIHSKITGTSMDVEEDDDEIDDSGPEITDDAEALEYDDAETVGAEIALNNAGHQGDVFDGDIGGPSYLENANIDFATIQLKRTGGTMGGPKDYVSSNLGGFKDVFYILAADGSIDFSEQPTKARHTSYSPIGKRKKIPFKHGGIQWANPNLGGSKIDLKKHPNVANIDTKNRPQHFGMADALYSKMKGWKTASDTAKFRAGKWTWHHLPTQYEMILVDMQAHAKHGHNGGVYIW